MPTGLKDGKRAGTERDSGLHDAGHFSARPRFLPTQKDALESLLFVGGKLEVIEVIEVIEVRVSYCCVAARLRWSAACYAGRYVEKRSG